MKIHMVMSARKTSNSRIVFTSKMLKQLKPCCFYYRCIQQPGSFLLDGSIFQPSLVYLAASPYHSICLTGAPSFLRYNFGTISIINVVFILVFWILYCYSWRQNLRRSPNDMLFESVPFLHHCDTNLVSIFTIFITPAAEYLLVGKKMAFTL